MICLTWWQILIWIVAFSITREIAVWIWDNFTIQRRRRE